MPSFQKLEFHFHWEQRHNFTVQYRDQIKGGSLQLVLDGQRWVYQANCLEHLFWNAPKWLCLKQPLSWKSSPCFLVAVSSLKCENERECWRFPSDSLIFRIRPAQDVYTRLFWLKEVKNVWSHPKDVGALKKKQASGTVPSFLSSFGPTTNVQIHFVIFWCNFGCWIESRTKTKWEQFLRLFATMNHKIRSNRVVWWRQQKIALLTGFLQRSAMTKTCGY